MGYFSNEDIEIKEKEEVEDMSNYSDEKIGEVVKTKRANIRRAPSRNGEVLGTLIQGTEIQIIGQEEDYYKVKYKSYPSAYIAKHFIEVK